MTLMKSVFDYDDDEEEQETREKSPRLAKLATKFHMRSKSSGAAMGGGGDKLMVLMAKRNKPRSLSRRLKDVFGRRKGDTM